MISSSEDEEEINGWEKEEYKEFSDSDTSSDYFTESEKSIETPIKKKKRITTEPSGKNVIKSSKKTTEYSIILQEETDFLTE